MKKILLVTDEKGWVLERKCHEIKKRLTEYNIHIGYYRKIGLAKDSLKYDLIYLLDPFPIDYFAPEKCIIGLQCEFLYKDFPSGPKRFYERPFGGRKVSIKDGCRILQVVNRRQIDTFKDIVTDKPLLLAQHGVNDILFNRKRHKRINNNILTVGTVGNEYSFGHKGFEFVEKACQKMGLRHIKARYDKNKRIPIDRMPEFYSNIDVFVSMSETEGLANPIIEAGAMGIPVISTRCGAAEEMIKDRISGLLIERDTDALIRALEKMKYETVRKAMGNKFYEEIMQNWTWETKITGFRQMFELFFKKEI